MLLRIPFLEDLGTVPDVKIITVAAAYDDPEAWPTYILFYHHALHIPTMQRHLLNIIYLTPIK